MRNIWIHAVEVWQLTCELSTFLFVSWCWLCERSSVIVDGCFWPLHRWEVGSRSREMRLWVIWLTLSTCLIMDYTCVYDTFMCIFAYACAYVSIHVCVDVCVHVCTCVYVCVHKCTCVYTRWCMCRFVHTHWSALLTCYVFSLHMYTHVSACTRMITYVGDSLDFIAPWLIFIDFHAYDRCS